jgi:hypothetical protein
VGDLLKALAALVIYFVFLVLSLSFLVGAVYVVFKIFGIDVEGFTA